MSGPKPGTLELIEDENGRLQVVMIHDTWPYPDDTIYHPHRIRRAAEIQRRLNLDGRACQWCGDMIPLERKANAVFCGPSCRKKAYRKRRGDREALAMSPEEYRAAVIRLQLGQVTGQAADLLRDRLRLWREEHGGPAELG